MKIWMLALAALLLILSPANAATRIDDPLAFVRGIYAHWNMSQPDDIYTPRLKALMDLDEKEAHGEVGRANDFSFWCDCQDGDVKKVAVKSWDISDAAPPRKIVEAKFKLEDEDRDIVFYFEKTKVGWKLDDVQRKGPQGWTLSLLCKYGFPTAP